MTTETILTDDQKAQFVTDITDYGTDFVAPLFATVESIEQAVLQSPEVQAWKRDAERMEWYFGSADKSPWMPEYMRGCNDGWSVDQWRMSIDAAMEKQK